MLPGVTGEALEDALKKLTCYTDPANNDCAGADKTLDMSNKGYTGTIPAKIGDMKTLYILNLSGNKLTGTIPPEFGKLEALQDMILSGNELTGEIPTEFGKLNKEYDGVNDVNGFVRLELQDNKLTGGIPEEIFTLVEIYSLKLENNKLAGAIPDGIEKLECMPEGACTIGTGNNFCVSGETPVCDVAASSCAKCGTIECASGWMKDSGAADLVCGGAACDNSRTDNALCCNDVDGCATTTDGADGCGDDAQATCSLGAGVNTRTCTCAAGYDGTDAILADDAIFGGCTVSKNLSSATASIFAMPVLAALLSVAVGLQQ